MARRDSRDDRDRARDYDRSDRVRDRDRDRDQDRDRDRRDDRDDDGYEFNYRGKDRTVEEERRHAQSRGAYDSLFVDGIVVFKPREGENIIRILPNTWEDIERWGKSWNIIIFRHYNVGPDNGTYLCLEKMLGKPCPICAARAEMEEEEAEELRISEGRLVWLVDRNKESTGPQAWGMPQKKVFAEVSARSYDKKTNQLIKIDDPDNGYDIVFQREGKDKRTDYVGVDVARQPTELHPDPYVAKKWEKYIDANPLPDILRYYDADYLENVLFGRGASRSRGSERGRDRDEPRGRDRDRDDRDAREPREPRGRDRDRRAADDDDNGGRSRGRDARFVRDDERGGGDRDRDRGRGDDDNAERVVRPRQTTRDRDRERTDDDKGEGEADLRSSSRRERGRDEKGDANEPSRSARESMSGLRGRTAGASSGKGRDPDPDDEIPF